MSTFEYNVIRVVQIADDILVVILPRLRWLVVSGFSAVFWVLGRRHPLISHSPTPLHTGRFRFIHDLRRNCYA